MVGVGAGFGFNVVPLVVTVHGSQLQPPTTRRNGAAVTSMPRGARPLLRCPLNCELHLVETLPSCHSSARSFVEKGFGQVEPRLVTLLNTKIKRAPVCVKYSRIWCCPHLRIVPMMSSVTARNKRTMESASFPACILLKHPSIT